MDDVGADELSSLAEWAWLVLWFEASAFTYYGLVRLAISVLS